MDASMDTSMSTQMDRQIQLIICTTSVKHSGDQVQSSYNITITRSELIESDRWLTPNELIGVIVNKIQNPTLIKLYNTNKLYMYDGGNRLITSMDGIDHGFIKSINLSTYDIYANTKS